MKQIALMGLMAAVVTSVGLLCGASDGGSQCGTQYGGQYENQSGTKDSGIQDDAGQPDGGSGVDGNDIWRDPKRGLTWQKIARTDTVTWNEAKSFCESLSLAGWSDWRLPTISELRSLIRGCPNAQRILTCGVIDSCLEESCRGKGCDGCRSFHGPGMKGCYWDVALVGPCNWYWSSSSYIDDPVSVWLVDFDNGYVPNFYKTNTYNVRCVRGP